MELIDKNGKIITKEMIQQHIDYEERRDANCQKRFQVRRKDGTTYSR